MANVSYFVVLDKATVSRSNTVALVRPPFRSSSCLSTILVSAATTLNCLPTLQPQDFGSALLGPAGGIVFSVR